MIDVNGLFKSFDDFEALRGLKLKIDKGSIYGLIGVNGSGKTTLIKHLTGILRGNEGTITMDGENVYDNIAIKERLGLIPDELYFFSGYSLKSEARFYKNLYPNWNEERYHELVKLFELPENKKLSKFSKGMQKQAAFILVMSTMPDFLILDEPVDGLDPIVRRKVWKVIVSDVADKQMTVLVSSHNLRELEGLVDTIGIMYNGAIKYEHKDLDELESKGGLMNLEDLFFDEMEGGIR